MTVGHPHQALIMTFFKRDTHPPPVDVEVFYHLAISSGPIEKIFSTTSILCKLTTYLSNTLTNLCMALLNFSLFCFFLCCYAFVQYCNVKTIQDSAMHKFVGVLDTPFLQPIIS